MKTMFLSLVVVFVTSQAFAQSEVYSTSSGELIFSWATVERELSTGNIDDINSNLRFTLWLHVGQYVHYDFTNIV